MKEALSLRLRNLAGALSRLADRLRGYRDTEDMPLALIGVVSPLDPFGLRIVSASDDDWHTLAFNVKQNRWILTRHDDERSARVYAKHIGSSGECSKVMLFGGHSETVLG